MKAVVFERVRRNKHDDGFHDDAERISEVDEACIPNKRDGSNDVSPNNLKFACRELNVHTAWLLSRKLVHGSAPEDILIGIQLFLYLDNYVYVTNSKN
jgi:hypothetical protein